MPVRVGAVANGRAAAVQEWIGGHDMLRRVAASSFAVTAVFALCGLLGWLTPVRALASWHPSWIPMAPSTALCFLLIASGLLLEVRSPSRWRRVTLAGVAVMLAGWHLMAFALELPSWLDLSIAGDPGQLGHIALGRMSPLTAFGFALVGLALPWLGGPPQSSSRTDRTRTDLSGAVSTLVFLLGLVVLLTYAHGAPLLSAPGWIPIATSTATAFVSLGTGMLALAGVEAFPLRQLQGSSTRARLLREFLPIAPLVLLVELAIRQIPGLNPALPSLLGALVVAGLIVALGSRVAHVVGQDVDRAQAALSDSARRFRALVENSADGLTLLGTDGSPRFQSPSLTRMLGFSPGETDQSIWELVAVEDQAKKASCIQAVLADPSRPASVQIRAQHRDGGWRIFDCVFSNRLDDPAVGAIVCNLRDVTERQRMQEALAERDRRLQSFFESDAVGILFADIQGKVLDANPALLRMTGYTRADLESDSLDWVELTPPEFRPLDQERVAEAQARGACTPYEKQLLRKDGRRLWILIGYVLLEPEREKAVSFVVDIDSRKRTEEALRQSEQKFSSVFRSSSLAIGMAELATGRFVEVNASLCDFFGYSREELVGHTVFELNLWPDLSEREAILARLSAGPPAEAVEARFRHKSGQIRYGLISMEILTPGPETPPLNIAIIADVTERKLLEAQFLQSQKMEAVGRLAGGIAHDFNNLLGVIVGYSEMLKAHVPQDQQRRVEHVLQAAQRAADLTRQLLAFSRKQILELKVLDLNQLVSEMVPLLRRALGEDVELQVSPAADLGRCKADPGQMTQVLMNLCVNARDAMPGGGLIRIETSNQELDQAPAAGQETAIPGPCVMLSVSDQGCGMDAETQSHLFEPFFTTKGPGKGTGLGLSTAYGIVKQSGGHLSVSSEPGAGTTFKVFLPRSAEPGQAASIAASPAPSRGKETVLLVEDEAALREVALEVLESAGYRVIEAGSGEEALEVSESFPEPIDLLLTDVVMTGSNGRVVSERLVRARPGLRVLFISGYSDELIAHHGVLNPGTHFLAKPFSTLELLERVRSVLDGRT